MILLVLVLGAFLTLARISGQEPPTESPAPSAIVIRDVTVIPMTRTPPIERAMVIIQGERITSVGPASEFAAPRDARVIDGRGRYLVPGFIEMHAHLSKTRASSLGLFVVNGVTTLRDLGGDHEELLQWRRDVRAGRRVGPSLLLAGPYLEATRNIERMRKDPPEARIEPFERTRVAVGSPDEARRIVASLAAKEIDAVKVRTVQDRETYLALNEAANEHGLPLVGHVSGIPPQVVLEAGQDGIEHNFYPSTESMSREERLVLWRRFAEKGIAVVPTLITLREGAFTPSERLQAIVDDDDGKLDSRRRYLSKYLIDDWREQVLEATNERQGLLRNVWESAVRDTREMHEAGMDVLAGSDVAVLNIFPGFSLHDEMALLVQEIGMSAADVLEGATSRAAKFLRIADRVGTVEAGKIADLVLLDANPLEDIRNTRQIEAVVLRGTLFDRPALKKVLVAVETAQDRRIDDWGRKRGR
ncbi:MAG: amidohydrolase family protein [Vicinamibacterales bacterium]